MFKKAFLKNFKKGCTTNDFTCLAQLRLLIVRSKVFTCLLMLLDEI